MFSFKKNYSTPKHVMFRSTSLQAYALRGGIAAVSEPKPRFRRSDLDIEYEISNVIEY